MKKTVFNWLRKSSYTSKFNACLPLQKSNISNLDFVGWFNSFLRRMPVDKKGAALPWYTYSAIEFLENRVEKGMSVFEYGSGNSTIWWAKRVESVISCEHDQKWFAKMKPLIPENVDYIHIDLHSSEDYEKAVLNYESRFDVVAIDGRKRVLCAKNSLNSLKDDGVIIWDNTDREKYQEGYQFLRQQGFRRLDFPGIGPINLYAWCTSVFYKADNCLRI